MPNKKPVRVYTQDQVRFIGLNLLHRLQHDSSITSDLDFDNDHTANGICGYIDELIIELKDYGYMKDVGILPYGKPQ